MLMLRAILNTFLAIACLWTCAAIAAAPTTNQASLAGALLSPEQSARFVSNRQLDAYRSVVDAYDTALKNNPQNAALAIARCGFIQRFAWSEDMEWGEAASKDFSACQAMLEKQFAADPEASLFLLEHRYALRGTGVSAKALTPVDR
ncbi:hypothetical protein LJR230_004492 [Trinickia sp. LjRoot230]|uniref:hypothetical protein n=1 Tax=Trinickia sp. LjRoot230 TaxID=3342288 RepID=UPI003ECC2935